MKNTTHILEAYRSADMDKRLCMFLDAPHLRDAFMDIEHSEDRKEGLSGVRQVSVSHTKSSRFALFTNFLHAKRTHAG